MLKQNRYFGSPEQKALEQRADLVWQLVRDDPRYACHGRAVTVIERGEAGTDLQIALARLQGVAPATRLTPNMALSRRVALRQAGLIADSFESWSCDLSTIPNAKNILENHKLHNDLSIHEVGPRTTDAEFDSLERLAQSCDVFLPAASFLRGEHRPAVCFFVKTLDGTAVGVAASVAENPPNSAEARSAWWGMLATDVTWRGRGIATHLGAMALVAMAERHGIQSFSTGIRSGHTDSIKLCTILGLSPTGLVDLLAIDPVTMSVAPVEN